MTCIYNLRTQGEGTHKKRWKGREIKETKRLIKPQLTRSESIARTEHVYTEIARYKKLQKSQRGQDLQPGRGGGGAGEKGRRDK